MHRSIPQPSPDRTAREESRMLGGDPLGSEPTTCKAKEQWESPTVTSDSLGLVTAKGTLLTVELHAIGSLALTPFGQPFVGS